MAFSNPKYIDGTIDALLLASGEYEGGLKDTDYCENN